MSERKIMPVSVQEFRARTNFLDLQLGDQDITLIEALAENRLFQEAVFRFDDATETGDIYVALFDIVDAAGKFDRENAFKKGAIGILKDVSTQAVLWTRHQQRKNLPQASL